MIDSNPVLRTAQPKLVDKPPEIFSVDELAALLHAALSNAPDVVPMLAIGAFAGVREAEIKRLNWSEVDQRRGHIEIKSSKAKSARRRIVEMQPNLCEWLRPYAGMTGAVVPVNARKKLDAIRKDCWIDALAEERIAPQLRHLSSGGDSRRAPRGPELGHTSPQMLYRIYRELVMPEEAERYWQIVPSEAARNIVGFHSANI